MHTLYRTVLVMHVAGGALGLLSMTFPLVARKGQRLHKVTGWAFTVGMSLSALTGMVMAATWAIAPAEFQPQSTPLAARLDGMFLFLIGCLTANALIQAVSAVRRKTESAPVAMLVRLSLGLLTLAAVCSIALGLAFNETLPLVFGVGSLGLAAQDALFTFRPLRSPMAWWYQHMNAMGTACISAVTAFLVLGARRWIGADVLGDHAWLLWLAPSALFVPLFQGWIVAYRRRFETRAKPKRQTLAAQA